MENEKLFSFMEKMYNEMQGMKQEMQSGFKEVRTDMQEVKNRLTKMETQQENIVSKISLVAEVQKSQFEQTDRKLDELQGQLRTGWI